MLFIRILSKPAALLFLFAASCGGPSAKPPDLVLDLAEGVKLELVFIPAGKFMMGSPETEKDRSAAETQHEVTISQPFYMGKYEVTEEQYQAVTGTSPSRNGAQSPVERVTWDEAQEFCQKLSALTGKTVQLPTEAQWEYACRAGTATRFHSGDSDSDLDGVAWYGNKVSNKTMHPVGQKKPNAFGLYDMHGNVWEWCADWYGEYAAGAATDPTGPARASTSRVVRGGGWSDDPRYCRSAFRESKDPDRRSGLDNVGFRVVVPRTP
ncbi:MAG: formylglycine-generating enzyme family protein [Planctomycetota bacterium]